MEGGGGSESPNVLRPKLRICLVNPARDPARDGADPQTAPCQRLDLKPLRRHKLWGLPLGADSGKKRQLSEGMPKILNRKDNGSPKIGR